MADVRNAHIRKKILSKKGVAELKKHSRKPVSHDELATPYKKTSLMKYLELKHHQAIEKLIETGTIYEVGKRLKLHPTTIYYWRRIIEDARNTEFFNQFKEGGD